MTEINTEVLGEETLSTATMEVAEIPLVKAGKYPATLKGLSVHCGKAWNSVPNISLQHKLGEEASNRVIFSTLLLGMHPDKNGQYNYQRKNGLKAFLAVLGTDIEKLKIVSRTVVNPDDNQSVVLKSLDAKQIVEALEQYINSPYSVRVSVKAASGDYAAKNDVFEFFPAE